MTAIEAVYVPADDFTDPAVTTIAAHVDSMVVLSRSMSAEGMYPAVDPIASSSILIDPLVVGEEHVAIATETRRAIEHYRELQDVIALLGMEELGAEDRRIVERARRLQRFLTQPFAVTEAFTGVPGRSVAVADTVAGCKAILAGECDDWRESSLYMVGTLDEARAKEEAARRSARRRSVKRDERRIATDHRDPGQAARRRSTTCARCAPRMTAAPSAFCPATPTS